jgi:hypothetical protein
VVEWTIADTCQLNYSFWRWGCWSFSPSCLCFVEPISRFADRHLHIHWTPKIYGILAPTLSVDVRDDPLAGQDAEPIHFMGIGYRRRQRAVAGGGQPI